jgi:hypothetical protein
MPAITPRQLCPSTEWKLTRPNDSSLKEKPAIRSSRLYSRAVFYAAFFCPAFTFAHRARCAAATFLRADADIVCFTGAESVVFATAAAGCDSFLTFAHRAC